MKGLGRKLYYVVKGVRLFVRSFTYLFAACAFIYFFYNDDARQLLTKHATESHLNK